MLAMSASTCATVRLNGVAMPETTRPAMKMNEVASRTIVTEVPMRLVLVGWFEKTEEGLEYCATLYMRRECFILFWAVGLHW